MKTRDKEALEFVLSSGQFLATLDGTILTSRDVRGKPTFPVTWRECTFISKGNRSAARKRLWINGQRVYANRVSYTLHHRKLPDEGYQVDHIDGNSMNDAPSNLQLMDCHGNIKKEVERSDSAVRWFAPKSDTPEYIESYIDRVMNSQPGEVVATSGYVEVASIGGSILAPYAPPPTGVWEAIWTDFDGFIRRQKEKLKALVYRG